MTRVKSAIINRLLTAVKKTLIKQWWGGWHRGALDGRSM